MIEVHEAEKLYHDLESCEQFIEQQEFKLTQIKTSLQDMTRDKREQETFLKLRLDGGVVIKKLMGKLAEYGVDALSRVITEGLAVVFPERSYEVRVDVADKSNYKTLNFILIEQKEAGYTVECNIKNSVGEGVRTVVSILCQVYYISMTKGALRALFLDEALPTVHIDWIPNLFDLFKKLKEKMGFNFLLITHSKIVQEYSDAIYLCDNGNLILQEYGDH